MPFPKSRDRTLSLGVAIRHESCWAKINEDGLPGINVRDHCLNVGSVAEALVTVLPVQILPHFPSGSATLAALHDVGKVSPGFQAKCPAWLELHNLADQALKEAWGQFETDHAKVSQFVVQQLLGEPSLDKWAAGVGAHHGRIKGHRIQLQQPWQDERLRLAQELIGAFGSLPTGVPTEAAVWIVAGLITVSDWIGSDERLFPPDFAGDVVERCRRARLALGAIDWRPIRSKQRLEFHDMFPDIPAPNSLQTTTAEIVAGPGVYVVEGPMGNGKTPAAVFLPDKKTAERFCGFFTANISNDNTRRVYYKASCRFSDWCHWKGLGLAEVKAPHVAKLSVKQHLAALRMLFDWLVLGHVLEVNPAHAVRGPKYSQKKGQTPVLDREEARALLAVIDVSTLTGLRDRALFATMIYTFARVSAMLNMNVRDYFTQGRRGWVRLHEKGGKEHEAPCHHKLETYLDEYIALAGISGDVDGTLAEARKMANHADSRTTQLYDRRADTASLEEYKKVGI